MIGAIAGDVIGSAHEGGGFKAYDFALFSEDSRFTDDTAMTVAIALARLEGKGYADAMREVGRRYPMAGYGMSFQRWVLSPDMGPYNSWGNGAAMRVSPIGFSGATEEEVLGEARRTAEVSHDHPEGIKGAQAIALAIYYARAGEDKEAIKRMAQERFGYDLSRTVDEIRPGYTFDVSCQGSVPESIICFLDGSDFESTVRNAVSLGGDTDTMACMAGGIAQAFYGVMPPDIAGPVRERLPDEFLDVVYRFNERFAIDA